MSKKPWLRTNPSLLSTPLSLLSPSQLTMTITIKNRQTLADIAIQQYGTLEAITPLAIANNIPITHTLQPGTTLTIPAISINRRMQQYCLAHHITPATALTKEQKETIRTFTHQFNKTFQ